jgi:hypothetical protein
LFESLRTDGVKVGEIVHLWTYGSQDRGALSLLFLVQALVQARATDDTRTIRLLVVSNQTQVLSPTDQIAPEKTTILGLVRTVPQEIAWIDCRHLDVDSPRLRMLPESSFASWVRLLPIARLHIEAGAAWFHGWRSWNFEEDGRSRFRLKTAACM